MKATYIFILAVVIIFSSCCHELQCTDTGVQASIKLTSFTSAELDTVILSRFIKGSNFSSLVDQVILDSNTTTITHYTWDSLSYFYNGTQTLIPITHGYDFEIFVPATNTLAKIDNINEPQSHEEV